ncbi:hypothetical protein EV191_10975 [Tamaricihabitans halophyticus]|uniref:Uncharacterized protein n=1 Tax=Tamaricihabitans halophyticus TaxID=1262583 RepID=A0A4R2QIR6_9PSEU|nr:hypothetical protein EV191_10975 [Tamaricihabitans halophyticus]
MRDPVAVWRESLAFGGLQEYAGGEFDRLG